MGGKQQNPAFPGVPAHSQAASPPQTSSTFYRAKRHQPAAAAMFTQMRHPQLCLSRAALHHNAAPCLAQKKKEEWKWPESHALAEENQWDKLYDKFHFICSALELRIETSLRYMNATPNFPSVSLLPEHPAIVVFPYIVPVLHPWLHLMPGTACGPDRGQPWGAPTTHGGSRHLR